MSWKTLTTFVTDMTFDGGALDAAADLAARHGAHLDVQCLGIDPTHPETYYAGAHALAMALPGSLADAERAAEALEAAVSARLATTTCRWSATAVMTPIVGITQVVAEAARFSDIVVAARPYGGGRGPSQASVVEAALFGAEVPVLVVPAGGLPDSFRNVALAWNDSPEALRAARAALPVLAAAGSCTIVIVDPPRHGPDRSDPGGRMAQMLSRHGAKPDVRVLARTIPSIAELLNRQIVETGADLLVMGAYGHSRLRESILGGATREMLEAATVPVLMVH